MGFAKNINYLTAIGHAHPQMRTVVHGDYEEIFQLTATDMEYPMFWVETPDINPKGNADHLQEQINNAFVIGVNVSDHTDRAASLGAKDITHTYIMQCLRKIIADSNAGIIEVDASGVQIDPVRLGVDHIIGWRVEMPTIKQICEDDSGFADIRHPSFRWDGTTLSEDPNDTLAGYDRRFTILRDGTEIDMSEVDDVIVTPGDPATHMYAELSYYGKHHELVASMVVAGTDPQVSIPYKYNPYV